MPRIVKAGEYRALNQRRGVGRNRQAVPTGRVPTERYLKGEALKVIAARDAGRLDPRTAEITLELIRIECKAIMDRNRARANGEPEPEPIDADDGPKTIGRPRLFLRRPKRKPYWRDDCPRRPYVRKQIMPAHEFKEIEEAGLLDVNEGEDKLP